MKFWMLMAMVFVFAGLNSATAAEHGQRGQKSPNENIQRHPGVGNLHTRPGISRGPDTRDYVGGPREHYNFRGRHFEHFTVHEHMVWRGGLWRHTGHGWFWVVGGVYYAYPVPIYPYPLFVSEVIVEAPIVAAPVVVVRPPLVVEKQTEVWYYCDDPPGYSPFIQNCKVEWRKTPITPPPPPR